MKIYTIPLLIFFVAQEFNARKSNNFYSVINDCGFCVVACIYDNKGDRKAFRKCARRSCFNGPNAANNSIYRKYINQACFQRASQIYGKSLMEMQWKREACGVCKNIDAQVMYDLKSLVCMIDKCALTAMSEVPKYLVDLKRGEIASYSKVRDGLKCAQCAYKCYEDNQVLKCLMQQCPKCKPTKRSRRKLLSSKLQRKNKEECQKCRRMCIALKEFIGCQNRACPVCVKKHVTVWNKALSTQLQVFHLETREQCMKKCNWKFSKRWSNYETCLKRCEYFCTKCYRKHGLWVCYKSNCQKCAALEGAICRNKRKRGRKGKLDSCFRCQVLHPDKFEKMECFNNCKQNCRNICTKDMNRKRCQRLIQLCEQCSITDFGICYRNPAVKEVNQVSEYVKILKNDKKTIKTVHASNKTAICKRKCYVEDKWICQTQNCLKCLEVKKSLCKIQNDGILLIPKSILINRCHSTCNRVFKKKRREFRSCNGQCYGICVKSYNFDLLNHCIKCVIKYEGDNICSNKSSQ